MTTITSYEDFLQYEGQVLGTSDYKTRRTTVE